MGAAPDLDPARLTGSALTLADDELAIFFLNVGDGDSIVVRFPVVGSQASFGVIDSYRGDKSVALLRTLAPEPPPPPPGAQPPPPPRLRFVCATHPHFDHISGLRAVLTAFRGQVDEFWDSGFRFTGTTYRNVLEEVQAQASGVPGLRFLRPTSGFEVFHAGALLTVLSPSIWLRNRYDTYGVDVNNASIVIRLTYPVTPPTFEYPRTDTAPPAGDSAPDSTTVIFGGDAQTDAWGQVLQEFPHLDPAEENWARSIGARKGRTPLKCDLFKVSHHCSKRGVNLELLERMGDRETGFPSTGPGLLVSSCAMGGESDYGFPHDVTQELLREVREPLAKSGGQRSSDDQLGVHYTCQQLKGGGGPAGSIAYVLQANGRARLYRLRDAVTQDVVLANAQRVS